MTRDDAAFPAEVFDKTGREKRMIGDAAKSRALRRSVPGQIDRDHFVRGGNDSQMTFEYTAGTAGAVYVDDSAAAVIRWRPAVIVGDPQAFDVSCLSAATPVPGRA